MALNEIEEFNLLKSKVNALIKGYSDLRQELGRVSSENETLSRELRVKKDEIESLKGDNEKLKLSGAILGDVEYSGEARKRINELVREIDNCIALLNNI